MSREMLKMRSNKSRNVSKSALVVLSPQSNMASNSRGDLVVKIEPQISDSWVNATDSSPPMDPVVDTTSNRGKKRNIEETESSSGVSTTSKKTSNKKWFLQKFVDGVICGEPIDTEKLGFPIPIGRDPLKVKICIFGPKTQHISRVHAELMQFNGDLHVFSYSENGVVINSSQVLARGNSYQIHNGDSFSLGDLQSQLDGQCEIRDITFAVRMVCEAPPVKVELEEDSAQMVSDYSGEDQKISLGHSDYPIFISDDEEEQEPAFGTEANSGKLLTIFKEESPSHDSGMATSSSEPDSPLSSTVISSADIPCSSSGNRPSNVVLNRFHIPINITERRLSSDNIVEASMDVPKRFTPLPHRENRSRDFSTRRLALNPHGFTPSFTTYRHCILGLNLANVDLDKEQPNERIFIEYLKEHETTKTLGELTRKIFSYFCLEACARLKVTWKRSEAAKMWRYGAVIEQRRGGPDIIRLTIVVLCNNVNQQQISDSGAVRMTMDFVRFGSGAARKRVVLGAIHKSTRIDRRNRSGGIQIPNALQIKARVDNVSNIEFVDVLDIEFDAQEFEGGKIQINSLVTILRLCEIRELKKLSCLQRIPFPYCLFLKDTKFQNIWTPHNSLKYLKKCGTQISRITRESKLTSEQTEIICGALTFLNISPKVAMVMPVEGPAGCGKTRTLSETAIEAALARPDETVIVFCKWSGAADMMTLLLQDLASTREVGPNEKRLTICRGGRSHNSRVGPLTLNAFRKNYLRERHNKKTDKLQISLAEQQKRISELELSLEDQLESLPFAHKKRKLAEIERLKGLLNTDKQFYERLTSHSAADPENSRFFMNNIIQDINIIVCASADIETNILEISDRSGRLRVSLILIDQAQQILLNDLVPFMQLHCNKIVMFGDVHQSNFIDQVVRHPVIKKLKPFVPSEFAKICAAISTFKLTQQFRLQNSLRDAVDVLFYKMYNPDASWRKSSASVNGLASLTVLDMSAPETDRSLPFTEALMKIIFAVGSTFKQIHLAKATYTEIRIPTGAVEKLKESGIVLQHRSSELLDVEEINVLILPLFEDSLMNCIRADENILCSLMTRPRDACIVVGDFSKGTHNCPVIDRLLRFSIQSKRYVTEDVSWFIKRSPEETFNYLRQ